VLITFKSPSSVPPYRIENRTKAVRLMLRQQLDQPAGPRMAGAEGGPGRGNAAGSVAAAAAVLTGAVSPAKKELHSPRYRLRGSCVVIMSLHVCKLPCYQSLQLHGSSVAGWHWLLVTYLHFKHLLATTATCIWYAVVKHVN
jgi:hypothetical protein